MDPITTKLWELFLAADQAEAPDRRRTPADLARDMYHDPAATTAGALDEMGYIITTDPDDEDGTGEIAARHGEYLLMRKKT